MHSSAIKSSPPPSSSSGESTTTSNQRPRKKKRKNQKKKKQGGNPLASASEAGGKQPPASSSQVVGKQPSASTNEVGGKKFATTSQASGNHTVEKPKKTRYKHWSSFNISEGDHSTHLCPRILEVWNVWSQYQVSSILDSLVSSQQPLSPTPASHVGDQPSTSDNLVKGRKGRVKFPCNLCSGCHLT